MKRAIATFAVFAAITGCQSGGVGMPGSPAWFATATPDQIAAHYQAQCQSYGFQVGTPEMAQCIAQSAEAARNRATARSIAANQTFQNNLAIQNAARAPVYRSPTQCTTYRVGQTLQTNCN